MSDPFRDRVAVVTGGASGIGLAMARAFAARGARIALADVDEAALAVAEKELGADGATVLAAPTDVTRRESVEALAEACFERLGGAHVLCNNAGIALVGPIVGADPQEWETTLDVNVRGVVHGIDAFVPRMIEQGEGGHVVNTASMAGLVGMQGFGVYCVSKFAVVGLSESLERELREHGIGVHVLCPMIVATKISENSARTLGRPLPPLPAATPGPTAPGAMQGGVITADEVARRVVRGIERGSLYILTHPEQRALLRRRWERQDAVFEEDF